MKDVSMNAIAVLVVTLAMKPVAPRLPKMALEAPPGYWRISLTEPRSKAHKTGAVRAEKRVGKKPAR